MRNGADFGFLRAIGAPTIRCDDSAAIKMSFKGTFDPQARDASGNPIEINWLADEIKPIMIVDGQEHPLGVFLTATVTPKEENGSKQVTVEAYDRCWIVRDNYAEDLLYWPEGTFYEDAIEELLNAAGITTVLFTPTGGITLAEDREDWDIGTSYLTIINELLSEINYNPLWFNADGIAMLQPASVPTSANIVHTLDANNVESLLLPQISKQTDIYSAPNVFICICNSPDKSGLMTATAENDSPQSPLSITKRGRRIAKVYKLNNIADADELQAYADRLRDDSLITGETIQVQTALLPGFGVSDVTAIHYGDLSAVCIEREWSMSLQVGGLMRHTLERVVYNLE